MLFQVREKCGAWFYLSLIITISSSIFSSLDVSSKGSGSQGFNIHKKEIIKMANKRQRWKPKVFKSGSNTAIGNKYQTTLTHRQNFLFKSS